MQLQCVQEPRYCAHEIHATHTFELLQLLCQLLLLLLQTFKSILQGTCCIGLLLKLQYMSL